LFIEGSYQENDVIPKWEFKHTKIVEVGAEEEEEEEEELDVEDVPAPTYKKDDEEGPTGTSIPIC
jgi:hypothetical protein